MEQYNVTGMSCAACSSRVEKAVGKVEGVTSCSVSLLTNSMGVEGSASSDEIIKAVEDAGYGAALKGKDQGHVNGNNTSAGASAQEEWRDRHTPVLFKRFIVSLLFLIPLMYISMGHMMWNWPVPKVLEENHVAMGLIQLLFTIIIMIINQKFFESGFKSLFHGAPNMDTLVALGSGAAFIYSTYALFAMTDAQLHMDRERIMVYMHEFYFESAAMILTLITLGKTLESKSKGKTTNALKSLMKLAPKTAWVLRGDSQEEQEIPVEQVKSGDIFVVHPGEDIPTDGVVLEGESAVNEASLTGESIPVDKQAGDTVNGATMNQSGFLKCRATRVGEDTTLSQIIRMVSDAAATKAPIAKVADRVSGIFVPVVIGLALATMIVWLLVGKEIGFALARGITVLVISCPCALGLATPVAIMVGNGIGAKNGMMFKTAVSLEETGKVDIVALDKTGTITTGEPRVTNILHGSQITEKELLSVAYSLEKKSEHPLAKAIVAYAKESNVQPWELSGFAALAGNGVIGELDRNACGISLFRQNQNQQEKAQGGEENSLKGNDKIKVIGGNEKFISKYAKIPSEYSVEAAAWANEGKTPLYFAGDHQLLGIIGVADVMKEDSPAAIAQLQSMGLYVVMLTGDNVRTANAIGELAGVDKVVAGVLPDGKENVVRQLQANGKVAMVGDGINDAPALTRADVGIAIGAGTDIAIDAADVVLMKSQLRDVPAAIRLSRYTLSNIHGNLFWAFFYNVIGIPLAAGVWIPIFGWQLNPMFAAAAMSLSSFCVVTNALRLNLADIYSIKKDKKRRSKKCRDSVKWKEESETKQVVEKERKEEKMEKIMTIEGMMCGHCEATVKKCLEALEQVERAEVSHEKNRAIVTLKADISDEELKKTVEDQDYKVTAIQ